MLRRNREVVFEAHIDYAGDRRLSQDDTRIEQIAGFPRLIPCRDYFLR